ncbi:hypothetical protein GYB22_12700 [bacterium]|nr:hypothetical protein [bacterium]
MKIDKYTKVILTVIAVNLSILTLANLNIVPNAQANSAEFDSSKKYGLVPINSDGSVNVKVVSSSRVDVILRGINEPEFGIWDNLPVVVKE